MPKEDPIEHKQDQQLQQRQNEDAESGQNEDNKQDSSSSSESEDSDSDYDSDESSESEEQDGKSTETSRYTRAGEFEDIPSDDDSPEANVERFARVLRSRRMRRMIEEKERRLIYHEDLFDFPKDRENWREEDLKELWADAPLEFNKPGWDPAWADKEDCEAVRDLFREGRDPPIAPFYLPFRKPYPVIPTDHYDIQNPKAVIEELDRIEEFLRWVSYIFPDGSSYEGTVWDDLAHGKGVYVAEDGLVRYEGEWLQNNMEGHGVVEVDVPDVEPVPGSKLEAQMRAEGKIIKRDFMTPEDREWLEMDIEDSIRLAGGEYEIPFYENDEWIKCFGSKPEKGRYRYAGQWKHSRMHGCGVYEVNERPIFGRFYFGQLLDDPHGCDENTCALHAGIAEVAAAKARMFVNKPDGMVREERGPYSDPQHPYFYEEEDAWQAPGFINQFYEVPDYWKTYVHEVDQEREIWLNSFYKAPLRLPMPAELEYWWSKDDRPEFILINRDPKPDPEDPSKPIYTEDPLILHTPTGRLINYIEDEEHGVRLFWQPSLDEGEDVDPKKVEFLPLGFDEFYGHEMVVKEENFLNRLVAKVENAFMPLFDKLEKWTEEKKKVAELKLKLIEKEAELAEAELCLEEAIEDMEEELKIEEKEAEKQADEGWQEVEDVSSPAPLPTDYYEKAPTVEVDDSANPEDFGAEEEEDEDNDNDAPSSFGSVGVDNDKSKSDQEGTKSGSSAFSTVSFASSSLISAVPTILRRSFLSRKGRRIPVKEHNSCHVSESDLKSFDSVTFGRSPIQNGGVRAAQQTDRKFEAMLQSKRKTFHPCVASQNIFRLPRERIKHDRSLSLGWLHTAPETDSDNILSLHALVQYPDSCRKMVMF